MYILGGFDGRRLNDMLAPQAISKGKKLRRLESLKGLVADYLEVYGAEHILYMKSLWCRLLFFFVVLFHLDDSR